MRERQGEDVSERVDEGRDESVAIRAAIDVSLDEQWLNVMARVPKTWRPRVSLQLGADNSPIGRLSGLWHATVEDVDDEQAGVIGTGHTPAHALRALAANLGQRR